MSREFSGRRSLCSHAAFALSSTCSHAPSHGSRAHWPGRSPNSTHRGSARPGAGLARRPQHTRPSRRLAGRPIPTSGKVPRRRSRAGCSRRLRAGYPEPLASSPPRRPRSTGIQRTWPHLSPPCRHPCGEPGPAAGHLRSRRLRPGRVCPRRSDVGEVDFHIGATTAYGAFLAFQPEHDFAVIVLAGGGMFGGSRRDRSRREDRRNAYLRADDGAACLGLGGSSCARGLQIRLATESQWVEN